MTSPPVHLPAWRRGGGGRWRRGGNSRASCRQSDLWGGHTFRRKQVGRRICTADGELGWIEGRTVAIEFRWAEGRTERYAEIAAELSPSRWMSLSRPELVLAVKQATPVIPIVFATAEIRLAAGLVASFARPGGNVTGLSTPSADLAAKRLELLREIIPGRHRFAMLANGGNPSHVPRLTELKEAARGLGLEGETPEVRRAEDIAPAVEGLKGRVGALYVIADPIVNTNRIWINTLGDCRATSDITSVCGNLSKPVF